MQGPPAAISAGAGADAAATFDFVWFSPLVALPLLSQEPLMHARRRHSAMGGGVRTHEK
jgi:hypothetical protein